MRWFVYSFALAALTVLIMDYTMLGPGVMFFVAIGVAGISHEIEINNIAISAPTMIALIALGPPFVFLLLHFVVRLIYRRDRILYDSAFTLFAAGWISIIHGSFYWMCLWQNNSSTTAPMCSGLIPPIK